LNCVVQNGKSQRLGGPKSEAAEPGGRALGASAPPPPTFCTFESFVAFWLDGIGKPVHIFRGRYFCNI
jgi:hypothetical protein